MACPWLGTIALLLAGLAILLAWGRVPLPENRLAETIAVAQANNASSPPTTISSSVAVLPLINLNPDNENDLFAIGLHDEIINQLTKIHSLNVIARDSVLTLVQQDLPASEISHLLNVESVLNGTILFAGNQARVNLQLQDPKTGVTLWSSTYEANTSVPGDMFAIQTDIAMSIATGRLIHKGISFRGIIRQEFQAPRQPTGGWPLRGIH